MNIKHFELGLLGTNCYIIESDKKALVIDPGGDYNILDQHFIEQDIKPIAILLTHAHFDHIGAVDPLRKNYDIPVYMHSEEKEWLTNPSFNGSKLFGVGEIYSTEPAEFYLEEGFFEIDSFSFDVFHTPGHSPGSISFWFKEDSTLVAGDTLFNGSIGRTDLPFGQHDQLIKNIKNKILTLPANSVVYPGHGPSTTIEKEKNHNPFLQ
ncbi:MBL fold metallo-hydrolase [Piscibacillus sp. B03]|uniref:MBL fold metallo-hydrolase n=1 Tax=Piscibacillus sp. B03 TaxID=3457430 RepID=UPI003FCE25DF